MGRSIALHFLFPSYSISLLSTLLCSKGSVLHLFMHMFSFTCMVFLKHTLHTVMSVKIVEEGIPWTGPSTKQLINWQKLSESTLSEIWKLVKGLHQPSEHVIKKEAAKYQ